MTAATPTPAPSASENPGHGRLAPPSAPDKATLSPLGVKLEGKLLGVSRAIDVTAMAPHREALEAWKQRIGWTQGEDA